MRELNANHGMHFVEKKVRSVLSRTCCALDLRVHRGSSLWLEASRRLEPVLACCLLIAEW